MGIQKIAVVGAGWFGRKHCAVWEKMEGAELVAVCDPQIDGLSAGEQGAFHVNDRDEVDLNRLNKFHDVEALIKSEKFDLIDICTPENDHYGVLKQAVSTGVNVVVEKPFTTNLAHAEEIAELADKSGSKIYVGNILRFDRRNRMIKDKLLNDKSPIRFMSFKRNFQAQAHKVYGRAHPFFSALMHDIDLAVWFSGKKAVHATSVARHLLGQETPDVLLGTVDFGEGLLCSLENIWHVSRACPYGFENEAAIYTAQATIIQKNAPIVEFWGEEKAEYPDLFFWPNISGETEGALRDELEHYLTCSSQGVASQILPLQEVLEGVRIAHMLKTYSEKK